MRPLALVALLALAGCAHITEEDALATAGGLVGGVLGSLGAGVARSAPEAEAVPVEEEPDGGEVIEWPDAGGSCSTVGDRVCCTPAWVVDHLRKDGG